MDGQPFFFDKHVFDDDSINGVDANGDSTKLEFTQRQLENEKKVAFEQGKKAGLKESEAGLTKTTLTLLQKIERDMTILFAAEDDRGKRYEEEAVHLSLSIIKKLFPLYTQEFGEEDLKSAIKSAILDQNTPEEIKIELHTDIMTALGGYIKNLEGTLDKKITLIANPSFQQNECRILWPDGGIICNRSLMAEKTLGLMKEALAERGVNVHDREEPISNDMPIESEDNSQAGEA